jgi:hypothetical protein
MSSRIQVIVEPQEREAFRRCAKAQGESLSNWLREAGRRRLADEEPSELTDPAALRAFFDAVTEAEHGVEPDWSDHLAVIEASRGTGTGEA